MITRLMLSLKKAATQGAWNFGEPTMRFAKPRHAVTTSDETRLDTMESGFVGAKVGRAMSGISLGSEPPPLKENDV